MIKICAISDVHGKWSGLKIPECDLLISCGDYSFRGEKHMVRDYHKWLSKQPAKKIISVQGNHELWVEQNFEQAKLVAEEACPGVVFLDHGIIMINDIKIYCSAATPFFHNWAWNLYPAELEKWWDKIHDDTDIICTHGPAYGILDQVNYADGTPKTGSLGCPHLAKRIKEIKPDLHFCGHIHSGHGEKHIDGTSYYNVSICDEMYMPTNSVTIVEYNK